MLYQTHKLKINVVEYLYKLRICVFFLQTDTDNHKAQTVKYVMQTLLVCVLIEVNTIGWYALK